MRISESSKNGERASARIPKKPNGSNALFIAFCQRCSDCFPLPISPEILYLCVGVRVCFDWSELREAAAHCIRLQGVFQLELPPSEEGWWPMAKSLISPSPELSPAVLSPLVSPRFYPASLIWETALAAWSSFPCSSPFPFGAPGLWLPISSDLVLTYHTISPARSIVFTSSRSNDLSFRAHRTVRSGNFIWISVNARWFQPAALVPLICLMHCLSISYKWPC